MHAITITCCHLPGNLIANRAGATARKHQQTGPAIPAPADATILRNINTLARYVSKNGPAFEEIARTRNATDPSFAFLRGGEGAAYYTWKVQQLSASPNQVQSASAVARRSVPLTADDRGSALGETALPSSASQHPSGPILQPPPEPVQYSGFVPSGSQSARPNLTGIAEGDRSRLKNLLASNFQQPSVQAENSQKSSLQAGLQHRAPAPAAAVTAAQGVSAASAQAMVAAMANRFASSGAPQLLGIPQGGLEQATAKPPPTATPPLDRPAPTRSTEEWRPAPLLCKRFNVMDPYKGKADRTVQMSRFKTDYLALPDTMAAVGQQPSAPQDALTSQSDAIQQQQPEQLQQQLPPPPQRHPQQQLPGPPPRFQDNSAAAAAAVIEQPQDGAAMADAFLSSLGMEMAAAASNQGEPGPQGHKQQVQTQPGSESDAGASTGESVQHDRLSAYFTHARLVTVA
jgi:G patch domain-containing protein 1